MVTTESNILPVFESNYTSKSTSNQYNNQLTVNDYRENKVKNLSKMTSPQTLFGAGVGGIANSDRRRNPNAPLRWHYNTPHFACATGRVVIAHEGSNVQRSFMDSNKLCNLAPATKS